MLGNSHLTSPVSHRLSIWGAVICTVCVLGMDLYHMNTLNHRLIFWDVGSALVILSLWCTAYFSVERITRPNGLMSQTHWRDALVWLGVTLSAYLASRSAEDLLNGVSFKHLWITLTEPDANKVFKPGGIGTAPVSIKDIVDGNY